MVTLTRISNQGGGISCVIGSLEITASIVRDNFVMGSGSGINIISTDTSITSCQFEQNAATNGGAIMFGAGNPPTPLTILDCTFTANTALNRGGAINYSGLEHFQLSNCTFLDNESNNEGGAIFADLGTINIDKCEFMSNSTVHGGGAVRIESNTIVTFSDCLFNKNTGQLGAAVFCDGGLLEVPKRLAAGNSTTLAMPTRPYVTIPAKCGVGTSRNRQLCIDFPNSE